MRDGFKGSVTCCCVLPLLLCLLQALTLGALACVVRLYQHCPMQLPPSAFLQIDASLCHCCCTSMCSRAQAVAEHYDHKSTTSEVQTLAV